MDEALVGPEEKGQDLVALDDALKGAVRSGPAQELVWWSCAFLVGCSAEETAEVLKVHPNTVLRDWRLAKMWLQTRDQQSGT